MINGEDIIYEESFLWDVTWSTQIEIKIIIRRGTYML